MQILKERKAKGFTHVMANGKEEQTAAILAELAHGGGLGMNAGKQQIRLAFSLFRVEQADRLTGLEGRYGLVHAGFHDER